MNEITYTIPIAYGFCVLVSAILLISYLRIVKEKHIWMKLMLVSVCVVNLGYLYLSLSTTLAHALMANRISYLGNVFQPVFILLTVANICRIKIKKPLTTALHVLAGIMLICACTMGVVPVFYKTVDYAVVNGAVKLIKTYGILHSIYTVYILVFTVVVILITAYSIVNKKLVFYRYVIMMVLISFTNVVVWMIEQFYRGNYEFLSVSYIFTCLLMILLYAELSENGLLDSYHTVIPVSMRERIIEQEPEESVAQPATSVDFSDGETLSQVCHYYSDNKILTKRETEILVLVLQGYKRKEIAEKLFITENTVKTHLSKIYGKLEVSNRDELSKRISKEAVCINKTNND